MVQLLLYAQSVVQLLLYDTVAGVVLEAINDTVAAVWYSGCGV